MKKRIYISIPTSGEDQKKQRERADLIKTLLSKRGYDVINPFEIYRERDASEGDNLGTDITSLVNHADEVFMCKGWQASRGCKIARFVAETYGKRVIFENVEEPEIYWR